ncbi:DUF3800 domain-containing protein [Maritalea mobilis]|uniref:DUF3800 domain-containing protein n=1 Tax=Maritalea mobilis TaxID=483324 RepID=UPI001C979E13|nr:DUF3800 domain-containing protein [Maritalea mobilis]MBY6201016.1 DUF3800 domain-containing protein [Maritalea mobilis]
MAKKYLFADEAGCFTFKRGQNISDYFIICTVTLSDLSVAADLVRLRRKMVWGKEPVSDYFHATTDKQEIRDQVFDVIRRHEVSIQATICEKAKAHPKITTSKARFYKYPWFYQFKHAIAPQLGDGDNLLVTAASIGTKKERMTFCRELNDVMSQTVSANWAVDFRPSQCDPCLQVADYCAWAIQRKWERQDQRSYDLIKHQITYEYDLWSHGTTLYY